MYIIEAHSITNQSLALFWFSSQHQILTVEPLASVFMEPPPNIQLTATVFKDVKQVQLPGGDQRRVSLDLQACSSSRVVFVRAVVNQRGLM